MEKETSFFIKELLCWLKELKKDRDERLHNIGIQNYSQLGFLIHSLLNVCQTHIFSLENKGRSKQGEEQIKIDIYTLLETAKNLLPHTEFEFLDTVLSNK